MEFHSLLSDKILQITVLVWILLPDLFAVRRATEMHLFEQMLYLTQNRLTQQPDYSTILLVNQTSYGRPGITSFVLL